MRYACKSDRGLIRELNEDSCNIVAGPKGMPVSFIIADGMGGHNSGEIASRLAVEYSSRYIAEYFESFKGSGDILGDIRDIMSRTNRDVYDGAVREPSYFGMGTTLIIAIINDNNLYIGHIGDSRLYLIRDDGMERITTDHSYVEELVSSGSLTREEADVHPKKNIITRALGCFDEINADVYSCEIRKDDILLLCTDGLTNMLGEDEVRRIMVESGDPEKSCNELISKANEKGGEDNITVIAVYCS